MVKKGKGRAISAPPVNLHCTSSHSGEDDVAEEDSWRTVKEQKSHVVGRPFRQCGRCLHTTLIRKANPTQSVHIASIAVNLFDTTTR